MSKGAIVWVTAIRRRVLAVEAMLRAAYDAQADGEATVVEVLADLRQVCKVRGYDWEHAVRRSALVAWGERHREEPEPGGEA